MAVPPRSTTSDTPTVVAAVPAPRSAPSRPGAPAAGHTLDPVLDPAAASVQSAVQSADGEIAGVAWIVREVTHVPGVLRLCRGRLSFESTRGVLFDGTPAELDLDPGRSPRTGLRVTVGGERLRVCVVRPAGAVAPSRELVERAAGERPATSGEINAWSFWRPLLSPRPSARARARTRVRRALALSRHDRRRSRTCRS